MRWIAAGVLFAASFAVGGCSSSLIDAIPTAVGGETAGVPDRPATMADYPAVNDRPPPRATKLITDEEQAKSERDLIAARDGQAAEAEDVKKSREQILGNAPAAAPAPPAPAPAKTKPRAAN